MDETFQQERRMPQIASSSYKSFLPENNFIKAIHQADIPFKEELREEGLSQRDIAEETGLSLATINRRLQEAKEKGLVDKPSDEAMDKVLELRKKGLSRREIAEETGLNLAMIKRRLSEAKSKRLIEVAQMFHVSHPRK